MSDQASDSGAAPRAQAPRQIVLCADGTGNSGGKGYPTNVWRLFNAIDLRSHERGSDKPRQIAFYDDGVGTEDFKLLRLIGGAFGWGLSRNIRELYESLARNYERSDRIFIFGFSRGAFTARSLAGLIARCGVVDLRRKLSCDDIAELRRAAFPVRSLAFVLGLVGYFRFRARKDQGGFGFEQNTRIKLLVAAAFNTYRERHKRNSRGSLTWAWFQLLQLLPEKLRPRSHDDDAVAFKKRFSADGEQDPRVQCVGVWDTVGALGAPADWMRSIMNWLWSVDFHDQSLHPCIQHGFQALSIDDERRTFSPILWTEPQSPDLLPRIEQVWFAGVHSNVGGGYPKHGLASVSLYWMMRRAAFAGLEFQRDDIERVRNQANVHDKLYDSRAGLASYYSFAPRDIAAFTKKHCGDNPARIHYSVFDRIASGVQNYIPANLPAHFTVVGDEIGPVATHADDAAVLSYWKDRLQRSGVEATSAELAKHWDSARHWITARKALYSVMLASTFAFVGGMGVAHLRSPSAAGGPATIGSRGALDFALNAFLPEGVERMLRPTTSYFVLHGDRFLACLAVIAAYLVLRVWLLQRTQERFERFWSPLRGPTAEPAPVAQEQRESTAAE